MNCEGQIEAKLEEMIRRHAKERAGLRVVIGGMLSVITFLVVFAVISGRGIGAVTGSGGIVIILVSTLYWVVQVVCQHFENQEMICRVMMARGGKIATEGGSGVGGFGAAGAREEVSNG